MKTIKSHPIKEYLPHAAVLLIGTAVMAGGCFQNSLWFDESYSVGLVQHNLLDVIRYATYDVHPHLYYILLKLFTMVFGNTMPVMRLFSVLGALLFASLGLTHIRRDFGKEIGFWFSFCAMFCASTLAYALQIRMYTWAAYFVALAAIYCYRLYRQPENRKNRILFLLFTICSAYTHYFGLFAAAALNLLLLYQARKEKRPLKGWLTDAAIQIGAYIPGALVFLRQITLNGASWIQIEWPDLVFDLTSYHLLGDVVKVFFERMQEEYLNPVYLLAGGVFLALYVLAGILLRHAVKSRRIGKEYAFALKASVYAYFGVLLLSLTVSLFRPIYYIRYTVVICVFLFFMIAALLTSFRKTLAKVAAAVILLAVFSVQTVYHYDLLYDPSADTAQRFIENEVEENDVFLFDGANSFVITVQTPDNPAYFYNNWGWGVQKTYRAFGPNARVLDSFDCPEIDSLGNRVWTVDRGICYEQLRTLGYEEAESHIIHFRYHDSRYELILMVKQK